MTKRERDAFDGQLSLPPEMLPTYATPFTPAAPKIRRRREQFVQVPWWWIEELRQPPAAFATTWFVANYILHRFWKNRRQPFKLPNGALRYDGINRFAKWRALADLERRGLITIERRQRKSPVIHPILDRNPAV